MIYLLLLVLLLLLLFGPQLWVQAVLKRYNRHDEDNFPGNGAQFARHLLDKYGLSEVAVESTEQGDHYDPTSRTVRLTADKYQSRTLTAITVSAHECGHAIQHAAGQPLFLWRSRLARLTVMAQRLGSALLFAAPLVVIIFKVPSVALINILGAFLIMGFAFLIQVLTLPVELDASFNKALPILKGGYLKPQQWRGAEAILRAAAWTYVAASLASLLNFWRWIALLRR